TLLLSNFSTYPNTAQSVYASRIHQAINEAHDPNRIVTTRGGFKAQALSGYKIYQFGIIIASVQKGSPGNKFLELLGFKLSDQWTYNSKNNTPAQVVQTPVSEFLTRLDKRSKDNNLKPEEYWNYKLKKGN